MGNVTSKVARFENQQAAGHYHEKLLVKKQKGQDTGFYNNNNLEDGHYTGKNNNNNCDHANNNNCDHANNNNCDHANNNNYDHANNSNNNNSIPDDNKKSLRSRIYTNIMNGLDSAGATLKALAASVQRAVSFKPAAGSSSSKTYRKLALAGLVGVNLLALVYYISKLPKV